MEVDLPVLWQEGYTHLILMLRWKHFASLKTSCRSLITQNFILVNVVDGSEIDVEEILSVIQSQIGRHGEDINIEIELPNSKDKVTSCFERLLHAAKDLNAGISVHPALDLRPKDLPSEEKEFDGKRRSESQNNSENVTIASENSRGISGPEHKPDRTASKTVLRNFSNLRVSEDPEKLLVKPTCLPLNIRQKDGCKVVNGDDERRFKPEDHCSDVAKISGSTFGSICCLPGNFQIHRVPIKVENLEK